MKRGEQGHTPAHHGHGDAECDQGGRQRHRQQRQQRGVRGNQNQEQGHRGHLPDQVERRHPAEAQQRVQRDGHRERGHLHHDPGSPKRCPPDHRRGVADGGGEDGGQRDADGGEHQPQAQQAAQDLGAVARLAHRPLAHPDARHPGLGEPGHDGHESEDRGVAPEVGDS